MAPSALVSAQVRVGGPGVAGPCDAGPCDAGPGVAGPCDAGPGVAGPCDAGTGEQEGPEYPGEQLLH